MMMRVLGAFACGALVTVVWRGVENFTPLREFEAVLATAAIVLTVGAVAILGFLLLQGDKDLLSASKSKKG